MRRRALSCAAAVWSVCVWSTAADDLDHALALRNAGRYQAARETLEACLSASPPADVAQRANAFLGDILFVCGELEAARVHLLAATALDGQMGEQVLRRLRIIEQQGKAQRIWPRSYEVEGQLAGARQRLSAGDLEGGFAALDAMLSGTANAVFARAGATSPGVVPVVRELLDSLPPASVDAYTRWMERRQASSPASTTAQLFALVRYPHPGLEGARWTALGDALTAQGAPERAAAAYARAGLAEYAPSAPDGSPVAVLAGWPDHGSLLPALTAPPDTLPFESDGPYVRPADHGFRLVTVSPDQTRVFFSNGFSICCVRAEDGAVLYQFDPGAAMPDGRRPSLEDRRRWYWRSPCGYDWVCTEEGLYGRLELGNEPDLLVALESRTGALRWTSRDIEALRNADLCSGPVVTGGVVVIAVHERVRLSQYVLCGLDARTGALLWRTQILAGSGTTRILGAGELDAGCSGPALAADQTHVYYCSHLGGIARVDSQLGVLEWLVRYEPLQRGGPRQAGPLPLADRFTSPPVVTEHEVIVQPRDSNQLFVLSRVTGQVLTTIHDLDLRSLCGAAQGRWVVTRDRRSVAAFPLSATAPAWTWHARRELVGRGCVAGTRVLVRESTEVVWLNLENGHETRRFDISRLEQVWGSQLCQPLVSPTRHTRDAFQTKGSLAVHSVVRQPVQQAVVLSTSDEDFILLETRMRLECRDPVALRWSVPAPVKGLIYRGCGQRLLRTEPDRLVSLDLRNGSEQWFRAGRWHALVVSDEAWCAASRTTLIGAGTNEQPTWEQTVQGTVLALAAQENQVVVLEGQPQRLSWRNLTTGEEQRSLPLFYPEGLVGSLRLPWSGAAGAQADTPFVANGQRLRWVAFEPWRLACDRDRVVVSGSTGACLVDLPSETVTWWAWPLPDRPRRDAQLVLTPSAVAIVDPRQSNEPARLFALQPRGCVALGVGPLAIAGDRCVSASRPREGLVLTARSLVDAGLSWETPVLHGLDSFQGGAVYNDHVIAVGNRIGTGELCLMAFSATDGTLVMDEPFPFTGRRWTLLAGANGVLAVGEGIAAWLAPGTSSRQNRPVEEHALWAATQHDRAVVPVKITTAIVLDGDDRDWDTPPIIRLQAPDDWLAETSQYSREGTLPSFDDCSATVRLGLTDEALVICVVVRDDAHVPSRSLCVTAGDALELRFDLPSEEGSEEAQAPWLHCALALVDGVPRLERFGGAVPLEASPVYEPWLWRPVWAGERVDRAKETQRLAAVNAAEQDLLRPLDPPPGGPEVLRRQLRCGLARECATTTYEVAIPCAWLGSCNAITGAALYIAIHDNDGSGRKGVLAWVPGSDGPGIRSGRLALSEEPGSHRGRD